MNQYIYQTKQEMGKEAAARGAAAIRDAITRNGSAHIIVATGASQFEMLEALTRERDVPWHKVSAFHLDEYVGLPITHPASFRLYLWQRFVSKLPLPLAAFNYVNAEKEPQKECDRLGKIIHERPVDVAFIGIGENGHLAFNDPPANFDVEDPYIVVNLDDACRRQQLGEGWFPTFDDVPKQAISMSIKHILKSKQIVCTVPDQRKAKAVADAVKGAVTNHVPASILQKHGNTDLFLDQAAASLLKS
ncbi:MAG TPA: glucosamine-6-phosphate deaminase [Tepidisphaeraceae bacterium]|jgi:glucosamine-6-phosphate deaminase